MWGSNTVKRRSSGDLYNLEKLCVNAVDTVLKYLPLCCGELCGPCRVCGDGTRKEVGKHCAGDTVEGSSDLKGNARSDDIEELDSVVVLSELTLEGYLEDGGGSKLVAVVAPGLEHLSAKILIESRSGDAEEGVGVTYVCKVHRLCFVQLGSGKDGEVHLANAGIKVADTVAEGCTTV